jgi:outer membrane murein-binding lipoprotein Lpp
MKKKLTVSLIATVFLMSVILTGCQSGVSQDMYDSAIAQVNNAQDTISQLQDEVADLNEAREAAEEDLQEALDTIDALQVQISSMAGQYDLTGETTVETVKNIIEYYHDTHAYSAADLFVCSDMAAEVWSMLKAQGIDSLIVVGNKDTAINDIILSDHAWLLAEVGEGQYLAVETTGGYVVYENENPLYYQGWYFDSPADMKSYNELVREYNVRVEIRNYLATEVNKAAEVYNQSSNPTESARLLAVYEKLLEIEAALEADILAVEATINSLATRCST